MKQIGCVALAVVIALQSGGSLFFSLVKLSIWKIDISKNIEHISSESKKDFVFTLSEFSKIRVNKKEFVFDGKMYDIERSTIKENVITILARQDHKEDHLLVTLKDHFKDLSKDKSSPLAMMIKMMSQIFIIPDIEPFLLAISTSKSNLIEFSEFYTFQFYSSIDPPPIFPFFIT